MVALDSNVLQSLIDYLETKTFKDTSPWRTTIQFPDTRSDLEIYNVPQVIYQQNGRFGASHSIELFAFSLLYACLASTI
jgi:hypothetical protein